MIYLRYIYIIKMMKGIYAKKMNYFSIKTHERD